MALASERRRLVEFFSMGGTIRSEVHLN